MSDWNPPAVDSELDSFDNSVTVANLLIELEDRLLPRQPTLLEWCAPILRLMGAASLGFLAACISILFMYIVLTLIFHFQPS